MKLFAEGDTYDDIIDQSLAAELRSATEAILKEVQYMHGE